MRDVSLLLNRLRMVARDRGIVLAGDDDFLISSFLPTLVDRVRSDLRTWGQKAAIARNDARHLWRTFNYAARKNDYSPVAAMAPHSLLNLAEAVGLLIAPTIARPSGLVEGVIPTPRPPLGWQRVDWTHAAAREDFRQMCQEAKQILSLHERMEGWMMPEAMHRWWFKERLAVQRYDEKTTAANLASNELHRLRSYLVREHSSCLVRTLASPETFVKASSQRSGKDWLAELADVIKKWAEVAPLSIADNDRWLFAKRTIEERLGRTGWHKLALIVDADGEEVAVCWTSIDTWFSTRDPDDVKKFRLAIEAAIGTDETAADTVRTLRKIANGKW